ncbi:MAG TPA: phosphopyruvate hydratase, partial [Chloroflexota bacterium]|nr:phosphopyruvate hydratase [Chloroflexota bacterium]
MNTAIGEVLAWEALDSRGTPTVACEVRLAGGAAGTATVPSGASTGAHEAHELRDGGTRYGGRGVRTAVGNVLEILGPAARGLDAQDQHAVDAALRAADGTANLGRLGANAVLAVSIATALAAAQANGVPLYRWLAGSDEPLLPLPMVNVLSG